MNNLNASNYNYSGVYRFNEFEDILTKITSCYQNIVVSDCGLCNNENMIRDYLYDNYLNNDECLQRIGLNKYLFSKEANEDFGNGRVDIKICSQKTFEDKKAYYIIECKRIDNKNTTKAYGLNGKYITDGVNRFLSTDKYSSYYNVNAMIGFVVEQLDIDSNVDKINVISRNLLIGSCTKEIQKENFIPNFTYHYSSCYIKEDGSNIKLYHLMYDVSSKII